MIGYKLQCTFIIMIFLSDHEYFYYLLYIFTNYSRCLQPESSETLRCVLWAHRPRSCNSSWNLPVTDEGNVEISVCHRCMVTYPCYDFGDLTRTWHCIEPFSQVYIKSHHISSDHEYMGHLGI